jgi:hypothetical protein
MTRGAQNLYWKLLRKSAEHKFPKASVETHTAMADLLHNMFKHMHNNGLSTRTLNATNFSIYFQACQRDCILMFGVTGMDEDDKEFDHGFEPVNPK